MGSPGRVPRRVRQTPSTPSIRKCVSVRASWSTVSMWGDIPSSAKSRSTLPMVSCSSGCCMHDVQQGLVEHGQITISWKQSLTDKGCTGIENTLAAGLHCRVIQCQNVWRTWWAISVPCPLRPPNWREWMLAFQVDSNGRRRVMWYSLAVKFETRMDL